MFNNCETIIIIINKSNNYIKDYKKKLLNKNLQNEINRVSKIENLIIESNNMKELMLNPLSKVYSIEKKKGNLKEIYTAKINSKLRLYIKPCSSYPYNNLETIVELNFIEIDDKHYGEFWKLFKRLFRL